MSYAWGFRCPLCNYESGCPECASRRNCNKHKKLILKFKVWMASLKCGNPACGYEWDVDTHHSPGGDAA